MASLRLAALLLLAGFAQASHAQDSVRTALKRLNEKYAGVKSYSMHITVSAYETVQSAEAEQIITGWVKKNEHCYASGMLGQVTLLNEHCQLLVDDNQKVIAVSENKATEKKSQYSIDFFLDSIILKKSTFRFIARSAQQCTIEMTSPGAGYKSMWLRYDPSTMQITGVDYFFDVDDEQPYAKVDVSYSEVRINPALSDDEFSEKKYITHKSGKYNGTGMYAAYQVLDNSVTPQFPTE